MNRVPVFKAPRGKGPRTKKKRRLLQAKQESQGHLAQPHRPKKEKKPLITELPKEGSWRHL